ncbi:protein kinase [Mycobacterium persicum]|uniref:non-specific serine/threonine protein kinase n=2 Tax=Mycobacterium persicum TaxID=1487726 RepID=A0A8E2IR67_9MYCO|nr:protein kinase [Mycobacterium persicum]ORB95049.1 protein kinase [Mycobacterium persicum]ORC07043.1 protein kinase [Mycobacterium persicum]
MDGAMIGLSHQGPGIGLKAGEIFAGYTIVRLLGSGGMGEVYLAQHPRLPRREALKILGSEVSADDDYRRRFIREADVASALWHPNIVRVNDRGEFDGKLWISMDFVDGTDVASLLRSRFPAGMPAAQVATIIAAIASALDYAHQHHDVMHRDVSPANILLAEPDGADQRILLGDFGIARSIGETSGLTATNMTIGTFPYAAPEQLTGEPIDGRADQYALAATAYHLLTGSPLFPHTNPAVVISRHLTTPPPVLAQIHPLLAAFDPVLAVALAKDPADRFACCTDFAGAFAHAARRVEHPMASASTLPRPLASRPLNGAAVPSAVAEAGPRQRRSGWRLFAAASTVIAVTAVGASGYPFDAGSIPGPPAAPPTVASPRQVAEHPPPPAVAPPRQVAEYVPPPAAVQPPTVPTRRDIPPAASAAVAPTPRRPAPVPQQPTPNPEQTFLGLVSQIPGVIVTDPATAAATGRGVCTDLQNGASPDDAAAATVNNTGISPAQAAAGVNAAITAFCPQHQG